MLLGGEVALELGGGVGVDGPAAQPGAEADQRDPHLFREQLVVDAGAGDARAGGR